MECDYEETVAMHVLERVPALKPYHLELIIHLGLGYPIDVEDTEEQLLTFFQENSERLLRHVIGTYDTIEDFVEEYVYALDIPETLKGCIDLTKAWIEHYYGDYYAYKIKGEYSIVTYDYC